MICATNCFISLLFTRKFNCARKLCFKYIYPTDTTEKTKVSCLVCQKLFETIEHNFMVKHHFNCINKLHLNSVNRSQVAGLPTTAKTIVPSSQGAKQPACNYTVNTTSRIDLNQLQFDKFKFVLGGNTCNYGIKCRICKEVFRMDEMKLLQHRYAICTKAKKISCY